MITLLVSLFLQLPAFAGFFYFPAQDDGFKALSQKFEFSMEEKAFQIGNLSIQYGSLDALKTADAKQFLIRVPTVFFQDYELSLVDSTGKSFWSERFQGKPKSPLKVPAAIPLLKSRANQFAYFRICLNQESETSKIFLCSRELVYKNEHVVGLAKSSETTESVTINGQNIGKSAVVYLNQTNETLNLRAVSKSGMLLEIMTRKQNFSIHETILLQDKKHIRIRLKGIPPPLNTKVTYNKSEDVDDWSVDLPIDRTFIYLRNYRGIPIKQEFAINQLPPSEEIKISEIGKIPSPIYADHLDFLAETNASYNLTSTHPSLDINQERPGIWKFHLHGLRPGNTEAFTFKIESGNEVAAAAFDLKRKQSLQLDVGLNLATTPLVGYSYFRVQKKLALSVTTLNFDFQTNISQFSHLDARFLIQPQYLLIPAQFGLGFMQLNYSGLTGSFYVGTLLWQNENFEYLRISYGLKFRGDFDSFLRAETRYYYPKAPFFIALGSFQYNYSDNAGPNRSEQFLNLGWYHPF